MPNMSAEQALEFVDELALLKFFPVGDTARLTMARKLMEWCKGDLAAATWLVKDGIADMDEYPGPGTLRDLVIGYRKSLEKSSRGLDPYVTWEQPKRLMEDE